MISKILEFFLKTIIILALLNGMLDGFLSAQRWVRNSFAVFQANHPGLISPIAIDTILEPGVGKTPIPISLPGFTVAQDGRRAPQLGDAPSARHRILMLGASQTFGIKIPDELIVSRVLEKNHPGWEVMNYAVPGETLFTNRIRFSFLEARGLNADQLLVMASVLEIMDRCLTPPPAPEEKHTLALVRLLKIIGNRFSNASPPPISGVSACAEPERARALAHAIYDEMLAILATADRLNLPARIILSPTAFNRPLALAKDLNDPVIRLRHEAIRPTFDALRGLIADGQEPRIIDLSDALDTVDTPFIDEWSHFSADAHRVIAERLEPILASYAGSAPNPSKR